MKCCFNSLYSSSSSYVFKSRISPTRKIHTQNKKQIYKRIVKKKKEQIAIKQQQQQKKLTKAEILSFCPFSVIAVLHVVFPPIDSFLQLLHLLCNDLIFDEQKKREILLLLMIMLMIESIVFRILSFFFFFEYHFRQQNFFLHLYHVESISYMNVSLFSHHLVYH